MSEFIRKNYIIKGFVFLLLAAFLVFLDQVTKQLAVMYLKDSKPFIIIKDVLELTYLENTGAAFGIMKGRSELFLLFAPAVSLVMFVMALRYSWNQRFIPLVLCFLFISSGGIGNFIDRLKHAYVIDFIYFKLIDFPVFNVADIYVTCACFVMFFLIVFHYKEADFDSTHGFSSPGNLPDEAGQEADTNTADTQDNKN